MSVRALLALALVAGLSPAAPATPPATRPHLLWLVTEDNSPRTVGAYGDPLARTPQLDRLAATGIVFLHAQATAPVCAPCRSGIITGRFAAALGTQHMRSDQPLPEDAVFFPARLRAAGYYCTNNAKTDYNTSTSHATAWDESGPRAHWRNRAPGQPFFAVFNFDQSHESRLHTRQPLQTDPAQVRVPAYLPDTPAVRADLAQNYDNLARADAALGRILAQLEEDGLAGDTIVFYYGDHGGATPRTKRFLYAGGTTVPLIVRFPERFAALAPAAAGTRDPGLVSLVDLAPTVLSLAGVPAPAGLHGRAFAGPARTAAPDFVLATRDRMDERPDLSRMVTDGRWRYIRNYLPHLPHGRRIEYLWRQESMRTWAALHARGGLSAIQAAFFERKPAEELFDDQVDPDNVHNLAGDPAHAAALQRCRAALRERLLALRDTGFLPEPLLVSLAGEGSPVTVAGDDGRYPLARILGLLDRAQLSDDPDAVALLAEARRDPLPVLRYWGLRARAGVALPEGLPPLDDGDPSVRLAAAEHRLLRNPTEADAWATVLASLDPGRPAVERLAAANLVADHPAPAVARAALERLSAVNDASFGTPANGTHFRRLVETLPTQPAAAH